ncbi:hypothetical protein BD626DRAFT_562608 [Schizophyllum amplum]|uniref:Uncharacterized protein n=1 Tax=Schizophyllum amplum TaxID=97359 RepID=A0A550CVE8_9AGAR|nr:hypothetical protein BD626DRAFT_562608 [Auriculariopsis ampla]
MCCTFHVALPAHRRTRRAAADSPRDAARVAPSDALACPALTAGTRGAMREWRIRYDMRLPPHVPRLLLAIALVNDERPGLDVRDSERTTPAERERESARSMPTTALFVVVLVVDEDSPGRRCQERHLPQVVESWALRRRFAAARASLPGARARSTCSDGEYVVEHGFMLKPTMSFPTSAEFCLAVADGERQRSRHDSRLPQRLTRRRERARRG